MKYDFFLLVAMHKEVEKLYQHLFLLKFKNFIEFSKRLGIIFDCNGQDIYKHGFVLTYINHGLKF